jgi:hypothetical protein
MNKKFTGEDAMSETIEHAREGLEHADHAAHTDPSAARIAVLIAALAAALALAEMGEKGAQNEYLTHHITVSDTWNFFQAKNDRATVLGAEADMLESLPNADQPEVAERAKTARTEQARLRDDPAKGNGSKQLAALAAEQTELRDHAFHTYHRFERVVGALQIAIVLASVSIVTRVRWLAWTAGAVGGIAAVYGLLVAGTII